jgi:hypothetical protein
MAPKRYCGFFKNGNVAELVNACQVKLTFKAAKW